MPDSAEARRGRLYVYHGRVQDVDYHTKQRRGATTLSHNATVTTVPRAVDVQDVEYSLDEV